MQGKGWKFLNSAEALKDSTTGYAKAGYVETSDGIHLTRTAMDALFSYIRTHSYITEDDRPALTTIPKHTGDKDAVVYTVPVVVPAETATPKPEATEAPASSEVLPLPPTVFLLPESEYPFLIFRSASASRSPCRAD